MTRFFLISLLLASLLTAVTACSPDDVDELLPDAPTGAQSGQYVRLNLTLPAATESRADQEGESHPDELPATANEFAVADITLFIYNAADGLNAPDDTRIDAAYYFQDGDTAVTNLGNALEINFRTNYKINAGDRITAVINMGDLTGFTTLGDLHRYMPDQTWSGTGAITEYTNFTMAAANALDGLVEADMLAREGAGTAASPLTVNLSVERTAARIDFNYSGSRRENDLWVYDATLANGEHTATVYVSHVLPVNVMQQPSYALKRISTEAGASVDCLSRFTYCGTLPKDTEGRPTAYVVEPHSLSKSLPITEAYKWYDKTSAGTIAALGEAYFTSENSLAELTDRTSIHLPDLKSVVLAYANENTQHIDNHYAECLTGLVIRAQYVPDVIHTSASLDNPILNAARGTDIWRYTPQNATTTEADVLYFSNQEAAVAYSAAHSADKAQIKHFKGGICYYNLWVRHTVTESADGRLVAPVFPMEYGIVRNHIYRVSVGFRGIGREGVVIEEPWNIKPEIYVRPWNRRPQSIIIM